MDEALWEGGINCHVYKVTSRPLAFIADKVAISAKKNLHYARELAQVICSQLSAENLVSTEAKRSPIGGTCGAKES